MAEVHSGLQQLSHGDDRQADPPRLISCRPAESGGTGTRPGTATRVIPPGRGTDASILSDALSSLGQTWPECPLLAWEFEGDFSGEGRSPRSRRPRRARSSAGRGSARRKASPRTSSSASCSRSDAYTSAAATADARAKVDAAVEQYVGLVTGLLAERARRDSPHGPSEPRRFPRATQGRDGQGPALQRTARPRPLRPRPLQGDERPRRAPGGRPPAARVRAVRSRSPCANPTPSDASAATSSAILLETEPKRLASFLDRLYGRLPPEISVSAGAAFFPTEAPPSTSSSPTRTSACTRTRRLGPHSASGPGMPALPARAFSSAWSRSVGQRRSTPPRPP